MVRGVGEGVSVAGGWVVDGARVGVAVGEGLGDGGADGLGDAVVLGVGTGEDVEDAVAAVVGTETGAAVCVGTGAGLGTVAEMEAPPPHAATRIIDRASDRPKLGEDTSRQPSLHPSGRREPVRLIAGIRKPRMAYRRTSHGHLGTNRVAALDAREANRRGTAWT